MQQAPQFVAVKRRLALVPQPRHRVKWPKVIGTISIVLGVLFLGNQCFQAARFLHSANLQGAFFPLVGMFLQFLLLAGGLLLRKNRALGKKLHVAWAWIMLGLLAFATMMLLTTYADASSEARKEMKPLVMWVAIAGGLMAIYPVFLLIWMSRPSVKRDLLQL